MPLFSWTANFHSNNYLQWTKINTNSTYAAACIHAHSSSKAEWPL